MAKGKQKLLRDLFILEAMAAEMEDYLKSDVLFWPMAKGGLPKLTLGGYLMRQHRLLSLTNLLEAKDQTRLEVAVTFFNQALVEKIVRLEQKAHRELEARIRQWGEYLKDLAWEQRSAHVTNYDTAVQTRAMLAALVNKLQVAPYQIAARLPEQVALLDANLRHHWQAGEFVWPPSWQPAYPQAEYWWLYGNPKQMR